MPSTSYSLRRRLVMSASQGNHHRDYHHYHPQEDSKAFYCLFCHKDIRYHHHHHEAADGDTRDIIGDVIKVLEVCDQCKLYVHDSCTHGWYSDNTLGSSILCSNVSRTQSLAQSWLLNVLTDNVMVECSAWYLPRTGYDSDTDAEAEPHENEQTILKFKFLDCS